MRMIIKLIIATIITLPAASYSKEVKELIFCTDTWAGMTNPDGTGSYSELTKRVYEPDYKVTIKIFPWARALAEIKANKCDGLICENNVDQSFARPKTVLYRLPLYAYFIKNAISYNGVESLRGRKLAWMRSFGFDKFIKFPVKYTELNNIKGAYKMLASGRFDILIDYEYAFKDECSLSGADCSNIVGVPSGIMETAHVVFRQSDQSERLVKHWDDKMKTLIQEGVVQQIFKKNGQVYTGP